MAAAVLTKYKGKPDVPFIFSGHSTGGASISQATAAISELCHKQSRRILSFVYLAPAHLPTSRMPTQYCCCAMLCCCGAGWGNDICSWLFWKGCCYCCCWPQNSNNAQHFNPGKAASAKHHQARNSRSDPHSFAGHILEGFDNTGFNATGKKRTDRNPMTLHCRSCYHKCGSPGTGFPTAKYLVSNRLMETDAKVTKPALLMQRLFWKNHPPGPPCIVGQLPYASAAASNPFAAAGLRPSAGR